MEKLLLLCIVINCVVVGLCTDLPQCFRLKMGEVSCTESVGMKTIIKTSNANCLTKEDGKKLFDLVEAQNKMIQTLGAQIVGQNKMIQTLGAQIVDRITRLENKIPAPTTPAPTTPAPTTPATTTQTTTLSYKDRRIKKCGVISSINDRSITASGVYKNRPSYGPQNARLNSKSGAGWASSYPYKGSWIQLDMGTKKNIKGVATQGRHSGNDYVKTYSISFKTNSSGSFQYVKDKSGAKKIFQGNTDTSTVVVNNISIAARFIRIHQLTSYGAPVFRFDVLTC